MRSLGATSFVFDENDYLQTIKHHGDEAEAKLSFLSQVADRIGISLNQCACIADGANDAAMFRATGKGITWPDSPIRDIAWREMQTLQDVLTILS